MSPQYAQHRQSWWVQVGGPVSTAAVLLAGCVDAPPAAFEVEPESRAIVNDAAEPTPVDSPAVDSPVTADVPPAEDEWQSAGDDSLRPTPADPTPLPGTVPPPRVTAEHTPLPSPSSLLPPNLGGGPEPTLAEPTPATEQLSPPPIVSDHGLTTQPPKPPVPIGEREYTTPIPRQIIVLSPKKMDAPGTATPVPPTVPVVVLPPSSGADIAPRSTPQIPIPAPLPLQSAPQELASLGPSRPLVPGMKPEAAPEPSPSVTPDAGSVPAKPISLSSVTEPLPPGFVSLFNGQDLTGWDVYDGKTVSWQVTDGEIRCVAPGGGWLQTIEPYSDFELRFDYRLSPGGNSGVSLRFPGQGNPSLQGLEIQLLDDQAEKFQGIQPTQQTGSLYFIAAPSRTDAAKPAGEWNQCTVTCQGPRITVALNGETVNSIDLGTTGDKAADGVHTLAALRTPTGMIALQSHATRVDYRNVIIKDLTQPMPSGVRWLDISEGTGDVVPSGAKVTVHYIGHVATGKRFGNSYEKGSPSTVSLNEVIPGWREGIPGMKAGGKRRLVVPAQLAYGSKGFRDIIPPHATLVYEIELLSVEASDASTLAPSPLPTQAAQPVLKPISLPTPLPLNEPSLRPSIEPDADAARAPLEVPTTP
ncbi:MAG: DUF1080 domain-containing protein [Planctomycetota bacterium]|nr:MAG: DUF1080 domain-containing protein [Planctomycetota bacterium]